MIPDWASGYLLDTLIVVVTLALSMLISGFIRRGVFALLHRFKPSIAGAVSNLTGIVTIIGGVSGVLWYLEIDPTVILAIVALATAAASLSLDGSFRDMIGTAKILSMGYYGVGDSVVLGDFSGSVREIGAFSTLVVLEDGGLLRMGNGTIAENTIINLSQDRNGVEIQVRFPIWDSHNRALVVSSLKQVAGDYAGGGLITDEVEVYHAFVEGVGEVYLLTVIVKDYRDQRKVKSDLSIAGLNALEALSLPVGEVGFRHQV